MNKNENVSFRITDNIKNLKINDTLKENLFFYNYHSKYLKKLQSSDIDKEDPHYISTYSSFIGEVYENIVYELLLTYAKHNKSITSFVLKGPHQNYFRNLKSGLMIDSNSQIVYKAGYKDVTEFDALFFTKESVYFVESTIVKTTTSLRKRLKKKKALLEVLFPSLKVKSLVILNKGALGTSVFPSYVTVWLTEPLVNDKLINELIQHKCKKGKSFTSAKGKKFIQARDVSLKNFRYFDTLSWILKSVRNKKYVLDFKFLMTSKLLRYFEIYSKLYIGYMDIDTFIKVLKYFNILNVTEDIPIDKIEDRIVFVTIEKTKDSFILVYYLKILGGKLKRLDIDGELLSISDKDPKGFTAAETKFMKYLFKPFHSLTIDDIRIIEDKIENGKF